MSGIEEIHKTGAALPEPSDAERKAIAVAKERAATRRPAFVLGYKRRVENGVAHIGVQSKHADQEGWSDRLYETFGTTSQHFVTQQLCRVAETLQDKDGNLSETTMESIVAILDAAQPANEIEAMLIIQMATTHVLILQMTGRCNRIHGETTLQQVGSRSVALSRLHRTFAMQVDALANLRRGGRQKIRVEHVHVYPGGQAVVGHVTTGGAGGEEKNGQQPHAIDRAGSHSTARCGAKTRTGKPCSSWPVAGKRRCRMHGGAHGSGAPSGPRNGNYRHGRRTAEAIAERRQLMAFIREARKFAKQTTG